MKKRSSSNRSAEERLKQNLDKIKEDNRSRQAKEYEKKEKK